MVWTLEDSYARELPGLYARVRPAAVPTPDLVALNDPLAVELGFDPDWLRRPEQVAVFAGNAVPDGVAPIAQAYSGHQFGFFSGLLGDGRALLLGEVIDTRGRRRDLTLKGSGRTPFSRGGDGKAVLGPVLREYLMGEAMHALGIPTTRALAAVTTGEQILRTGPEPGAVLCRVAASHLRVGTFEFVNSHRETVDLRALVDYTLARHDPDLTDAADPALALLDRVVDRQAALVAAWMSVGFIHGVMNTDNMAISGETIDYGPCAFMDGFNEHTVFSSIDHGGRYRYANQPAIAGWNLASLAQTLLPLVDAADPEDAVGRVTGVLESFADRYLAASLSRMRAKLGLTDEHRDDAALVGELLALLSAERIDYTSFWRALSRGLRRPTDDARDMVTDQSRYDAWRSQWLARLGPGDHREVALAMDRVNPLYIPRNHLVEESLSAARDGDLGPFTTLLDRVREPFTPRPGADRYATPADPAFTESYVTYCGT